MVKRATLASFTPQPIPAPVADGAEVEVTTDVPKIPARATSRRKPQAEAGGAPRKYPHVSVYLPADTIRTLKLVAIEQNTRVNDLCAQAITSWLEANGHLRGRRFKL
jgi:hypothetical protein